MHQEQRHSKSISGHFCLIIPVISILLTFSSPGLAADVSYTTVPLELYGHLIVIKGTVEGLEDLNFVLDTGSSRSILDSHVAAQLGLSGEYQLVSSLEQEVWVQRSFIPALTVGDLTYQEVTVWIASVSGITELVRIDGLIGLDLIKRNSISIDFSKRTVTFGRVFHGPFRFPFYPELPIIPVPFSAGERQLTLLLDTAADQIVLYASKVKGKLSGVVKMEGVKQIRHVGGIDRLKPVMMKKARIGNSQWKNLSAYLLDTSCCMKGPDGVLGVAALQVAVLNLDFDNNIVSWE
ncbi:MAG TPA: aspartyl protease family protein [Acidobacteriota bacterium]|nr:aspartyl protease family protein [Acidobacteriota bacterium]